MARKVEVCARKVACLSVQKKSVLQVTYKDVFRRVVDVEWPLHWKGKAAILKYATRVACVTFAYAATSPEKARRMGAGRHDG